MDVHEPGRRFVLLRITIELLPDGSEIGHRTIASADIGRISGGRLGTYAVTLSEEPIGLVGEGRLTDYPRYATSIWDLVARCIAVAMTGKEELPSRPTGLTVPIRHLDSLAYVRLTEIPEPARSLFERNIEQSSRPLVSGEAEPRGCAYLWDWEDFLDGRR